MKVSKNKNMTIELKKSSKNSIRLRRSKEHQINFLNNFKQLSGESYFLISLNEMEFVVLIEIEDFIKFRKNIIIFSIITISYN